MHELSITKTMLDLVLDEARKNGAGQVQRINLVIGSLSNIVDECVRFYFDFLSRETIAEGAQLSFKVVPAMAQCRACGGQFKLEEFSWACPKCGGIRVDIVKGRELYIESIEVE
jgi:hydrogenase nickel incorporation protein HypA/HybF